MTRSTRTASVLLLLALVPMGCGSTGGGEHVDFDTYDADPDWSPDGRLIAFASSREPGGIYTIRPDGSELSLLVPGDASDPDWSPDGRLIAFVGEDGVYVAGRDGRAPKLVVRGFGARLPISVPTLSTPTWAPDGRKLAFVKLHADFSSAIYLVELDGGQPRRLLPLHRGAVGDANPGSPLARSERDPAWSPEGRRIAFRAGDGSLVVASVDDGRRRILDDFGAYEPAWSPDGSQIAYQCEGALCVGPAEGPAQRRRLAGDGGDPSWAPDSRRVVFENFLYGGGSYLSDPQSLSIFDVETGERHRLTFGP